MKNNKKWFSLPLAMGIVILITLLSITILEYIIPFSREIKWVENSSRAYYLANSWIEEWLYHINTRVDKTLEKSTSFVWRESYEYNTISSIWSSLWTSLPPDDEWNSEYDIDWNTISAWNPMQLSIWNWKISTFSDIKIAFRVPDLDNDLALWINWSEDYAIDDFWVPIVNWQLSSWNDSLNSIDIIMPSSIIDSDNVFNDSSINLSSLQWINLSWQQTSSEEIWNFYITNCWVWKECTLKFSVVNKLKTDDIVKPVTIPYLEWRIDVWASNDIPLRYTKVSWWWRASAFKKVLEIKVPTQTVNEAFDFTVFQ